MDMDMNTVLKLVEASGALGQVADKLGVDEKDAVTAIEVAMPLLLKGMQGQMENKDTQEGFLKALSDHSKDDTKDLKKAVKDADEEDGAKIVNHLLGDKKKEAAAKAEKQSGLDTKTILKLMAILAPILMSKMGNTAKKETEKKDTGDMMGVVGNLLGGVDAGDVVSLLGVLMK